MQPFAYQLRDIHGLDPIPWWPPAPGWWLLAGALVLGLWLAWRLLPSLRVPALAGITWRWDAARQLHELRRRARRQEPWQSAGELSELLRRIAMARHGRDTCAGLTGPDWLGWLAVNDPGGYPWVERGGLLLDMPYAPPGTVEADRTQLLELIDATHGWLARGENNEEAEPVDV
jgi:hypothetical protein